jgi:tetratricopeptide (TPR) repeat protein
MTGDFNVAVAAFGELDSSGSTVESNDGADLADSLYRQLEEDLARPDIGDFDVRLLGPGELGRLEGRTQDDRAEEAARVAEGVNADLIIYGNIDAAEGGSRFEPEFYLSPRRLVDADGERLAGRYGLGSPIEVPGDARKEYRNELRSRLLSRTGALTHLVVGLTHYAVQAYPAAAEQFELAVTAAGWDPRDGKELAHLFLGNARGKLGDLDGAGESYREALRLEPEYGRAHLGRAEVLFIEAQGSGCESEVDVDHMVDAASALEQAQDAQIQPVTAEIPERVSFGLARIYSCLYSAGIAELHAGPIAEDDLLEAARREYQAVITAFDGPRARIRDMVAEAHGGLGLSYLLDLGDDPVESYRLATAEYETAESLSQVEVRRALFLRARGFIADRLDECANAVAFYTDAITLIENELARLSVEVDRFEDADEQKRIEAQRTALETERSQYDEERAAIEDRITTGDC